MNTFSRIHIQLKDPCWYLYGIRVQWNSSPKMLGRCCEICLEPFTVHYHWSQSVMSQTISLEFHSRNEDEVLAFEENYNLCENCGFVVHKILELYRKNSGQ